MDTTAPVTRPTTADLPRAALLERVRAAHPALVVLVAPAGFGKTTLARQLVEGAASVARCDCRGVTSELDVARRVVAALAAASPQRGAAHGQRETLLGDDRADVGERLALASAAWRDGPAPAAFVLENAEDALVDRGARGFVASLLATRPEGRSIVVCSREPLRMHLSRFAPPHSILTLRAAELAFSREEIRTFFAGSGASGALVERVAELSGGWPIAVLLLARFAHEGRLELLLDKLDDVAYEDLHEYLADHVLAEAEPATIDGLLAAAAIPRALERDLRLALADPAELETFLRFAAASPFVTLHDGEFAVHPLLAAALTERHPARVAHLLARTTAAYETAGEWQRVAEIRLAAGEWDATAEALERIDTGDDATPPAGVARLLAALDGDVIRRHPRLWSTTALLRTFTVDARSLLEEAADVGARVPAASGELRAFVSVFRALVLAYAGEWSAALELVDELREAIAAPELPQTRLHGWLLYLRALAAAPLGRTRAAERDLIAAWPFVESTPLAAGGALLVQGAELARLRGDRDAERERIGRALDVARSAGLRNFIAFFEAEATFGAWLAGDDAAVVRHAAALDEAVERDGVRGFAFFAAAARGRPAEPQRHDHPEWVPRAHLLAAASALDAGDAATALQGVLRARALAAGRQGPFTALLSVLALAEIDPTRRTELHAQAAALAQRIDADELHAAVASVMRGGDGAFLAPFLGRFRSAAGRAATGPGVIVELVTGRVVRDGEPVSLPEREHALLTAVAIRPEPVARDRLTDLLWPDLGETAARNAFHVCLHRLKTRLGGDEVVTRTRDGYRLGAGTRVDLWEIERALGALRSGVAGAERAAQLRGLYDRVRAARPARVEAWEWFDQTERRLRELRCEIAQALAEHALELGDTPTALALCHEMIAYDPCDEPAREIAIRAYLAGGDRAAALRHFRQYRDVLDAELQCEPSAALAALVGAGA